MACALLLAACGGGEAGSGPAASASSARPRSTVQPRSSAHEAAFPTGDWTRFDYDAARSGVGPADIGITAQNLNTLRRRRVHLDGTVDSSPIELHAIRVRGRPHDLIIVTTTYGRTIALDAGTGRRMWEFVPADIHAYERTYQITNTTPVADPSRRYVYAATPDGLIRKLRTSDGRQIRNGQWPVRVTFLPSREKLGAALNISGREVIVGTGGYTGDAPPYQGHVVTIDRDSGRILRVLNTLCSDRHRLIVPRTCPESGSAIWSRAGIVIEPGGGRLLVTTGNADASNTQPFDGRRFWADSVLELSPDAARLLGNWTPRDQARLSASDTDLGSSSPALLPSSGGRRLAVQGGKDGKLRLLDLSRLAPAGPRTGGELQTISTPGGDDLFTAPAVWVHGGRTDVFVADNSGTAVYTLIGGSQPRLRLAAANGTAGTSPIVAGGLLYVYDPGGALNVYQPQGLRRLVSLPADSGHWNSPIALAGRVIVPEGNANDHATSGTLDIYHVPGR